VVIEGQDLSNVILGLVEGGDSPVSPDVARAGVVGGQGQFKLAELANLDPKIAGAAVDGLRLKGSLTRMSWAVAGINCINPWAPADDTACGFIPDSVRHTAFKSSAGTS
jgi:hypothetical protein